MSLKNFSLVTLVIFTLITVLHLLRVVYGWEAVIGGWEVPLWFSWVALVLGAFLAYSAYKLYRS